MPLYPPVPDNRMAYDLDGTVVVFVDGSSGNAITKLSLAQIQAMNDESSTEYLAFTGNGNYTDYLCFIFPQHRNLGGYFSYYFTTSSFGGITYAHWEYSTDTTNGVDGTWTDGGAIVNAGTQDLLYRSQIQAVTATGIKGFRFRTDVSLVTAGGFNTHFVGLHLYGEIPPSENQFLAIFDPALNQEVSPNYFNWGDIPQSSNDIRTFRVHNYSVQTAKNVVLSFNDLTVETPDQASWHYLSLDGVNYFSTVNIGSLAPSFTSGLIYVQRVTPANAQLSLGALRLVASATFV